jgi:hypothetical protein
LSILTNLGPNACKVTLPNGTPILATGDAVAPDTLAGFSTLAFLDTPT